MAIRKPSALKALGPMWFRFTDPEDQGKYGDGWFKYDEAAWLRKRARELVEVETELGYPLTAVMNGFRQSTVLGDLAVTWLSVRAVDPARAGQFEEFNPITNLLEWTIEDPEPGPKDEEATSTTATPSGNTTSETTDLVVLETMPVVG